MVELLPLFSVTPQYTINTKANESESNMPMHAQTNQQLYECDIHHYAHTHTNARTLTQTRLQTLKLSYFSYWISLICCMYTVYNNNNQWLCVHPIIVYRHVLDHNTNNVHNIALHRRDPNVSSLQRPFRLLIYIFLRRKKPVRDPI